MTLQALCWKSALPPDDTYTLESHEDGIKAGPVSLELSTSCQSGRQGLACSDPVEARQEVPDLDCAGNADAGSGDAEAAGKARLCAFCSQ